jgi:hypothetical protein
MLQTLDGRRRPEVIEFESVCKMTVSENLGLTCPSYSDELNPPSGAFLLAQEKASRAEGEAPRTREPGRREGSGSFTHRGIICWVVRQKRPAVEGGKICIYGTLLLEMTRNNPTTGAFQKVERETRQVRKLHPSAGL